MEPALQNAIATVKQAVAGAALPDKAGEPPILSQAVALIENFFLGMPGKINYKLPDVKETQTFSALGHSWTSTEEVDNGKLQIALTPS